MKIFKLTLSFIFFLFTFAFPNSWIRINQLGYIPDELKFAVLLSKEKLDIKYFYLVDAISDKVVWRSNKVTKTGEWYQFKSSFRLNFGDFKREGVYYIKVGKIKSPNFRILKSVYNGAADFLLQYIRQQQCGYNPFLRDSCHTHDGFIIYHPEKEGQYIDVVGGWHDASDYLRYVTTSATTTFQLLFSYYKNPKAFGDFYDRNGDLGSDGIPDVLNSANWGLEWLLKMNPAKNELYNQIADDRDHLGFKLPTEDTISYGKGLERPVYFVTGKPQGLMRYKNRSDGVASTAAKFASTFAFASKVFENWQLEFRERLIQKSKEAYEFAQTKPGVCQTAPCRAPYFYEAENYVDDMALAAAALNFIQNDKIIFDEALKYLKSEPIVPWFGKDTARHYQWYPFVNLAHYFIAINSDQKIKKEIIKYLKSGLDLIKQKAASNPFRIGIPFIWCSNNLISSLLTKFRIYYELSGDKTYLELEAAHRDWLFGCNPWGTSMIVGFPEFGDFPEDPHSAFSAVYGYPINGGLVDGPVYTSIYKNLIGIRLYKPDEYEDFQTDYIVYHDDYGDYSTNEPTLDGTASLIMYLSFLHHDDENRIKNYIQNQGGIVRFDTTQNKIFLVFSAHQFGEGLPKIRETLKRNNIKGAFFFTGDFLRDKENSKIVKQLIKDGHVVGPHSDKHLLYCDWNRRDSLLITREEFELDLKNNLIELQNFGLSIKDIKFFLPPFEWYNQKISDWTKGYGLNIINFTPNTFTNADYTTPDMKNYRSCEEIFTKLIEKEKSDPVGLNGAILLIHAGTDPARKDKLYDKLDELIAILKNLGYEFGDF